MADIENSGGNQHYHIGGSQSCSAPDKFTLPFGYVCNFARGKTSRFFGCQKRRRISSKPKKAVVLDKSVR